MELMFATEVSSALLLISIKAYEVVGALQDNWATYWVSLVGRLIAASSMLSLGGGWAKIAPVDFGSAAVLGLCMALAPASGKTRGA